MAYLLYRTVDAIPEAIRQFATRTDDGWWQIEERFVSTPSREAQPREPGCVYIPFSDAKIPSKYWDAVYRAGGPERVRYVRE